MSNLPAKPLFDMLTCKVAGVTFENRQQVIAGLDGTEVIQIVPEPTNPYDKNALAVMVATKDSGVKHVGYVPREVAKGIADRLDGETITGNIIEITGGFDDWASYGLLIKFGVPKTQVEITKPQQNTLADGGSKRLSSGS